MVSAEEQAALRAAIGDLLPGTAYILTGTDTPDSQGGFTTAWGTTGTVDCRLDVTQGQMQVTGGAVQSYTAYILSLPYDTTVLETNRFQIGTDTFSVKSINTGQSWNFVRRVEVELV